MTLGDLGASVIKVERPGSGDESRAWGPPFDSDGTSAYFLSVNRNKLDIALDLDDPADRTVLLGLIESADVVLENFRRGTLERRGIDVDALLQRYPGLVWCTISGFGPDSDRPGYDLVVQAECGWMAITGDPEGNPMKVGIALADVIAGKDAAVAILAALVARGDSESPMPAAARRLHIALAHAATASLINVAQNALLTGQEAVRWGNAHPNLVPYQPFRASDRNIVIAVGNDAQWQAACRALGLTSLGRAAELATNAGRVTHRGRVVTAVARQVATAPAAKWLGALAREGVPSGVVHTVTEALQAVPTSRRAGVAPQPPGTLRLPPPSLDEHGALIRSHGWAAFEHRTQS